MISLVNFADSEKVVTLRERRLREDGVSVADTLALCTACLAVLSFRTAL